MVTGARVGATRSPHPGGAIVIERDYRYFPPAFVPPTPPSRDQYDGEEVSAGEAGGQRTGFHLSVDVDTGAYKCPPVHFRRPAAAPRARRTEEFVNYFRYDYDRPDSAAQPFTVNTDVAVSPWNADARLVRIGLAGYEMPEQERLAANLVFLLDVSGSMYQRDKLPLVKTAMRQLAGMLTERDRVSIAVYAGAAGLVLEPTNDERRIKDALDQLEASGSTAGGAGIEFAYRVAEGSRIEGGVNRVILATDGDFNVGTADREALVELIEKKRETGVTLSVLGFGRGNLNDAMMEQVANNGNGNIPTSTAPRRARRLATRSVRRCSQSPRM